MTEEKLHEINSINYEISNYEREIQRIENALEYVGIYETHILTERDKVHCPKEKALKIYNELKEEFRDKLAVLRKKFEEA